ncbi:hypothetical protein PSW78_23210, partial [Shigella flexneri]|nr:hypothetical protein [Shigella flexneri]
PLSPLLFAICTEGLSQLLQKFIRMGWINGCKVVRGAPIISHLFFTNDSFLFFKANMVNCKSIKSALHPYEQVFG